MRRWLTLAVAVLTLVAAREASAAGGTLDSPSIAVAAASGRDGADWLAVLKNKKYHFIVGDFINSTTNLFYAGDAESLSSFLADLAAVRGTVIELSFSKEAKDATPAFGGSQAQTRPCQWQIQHLGYSPEVFYITVYLGDGKVDISKLNLPPICSQKEDKSARPPAAKPSAQK
jgi:hypothetical protein